MNDRDRENDIADSVIVDSSMSLEQAIQNDAAASAEILVAQRLVNVEYFSFDGKLHRGQVVVHQDLTEDIADLFKLIIDIEFPIQSAIPIADLKFGNDDEASVVANNSSAFNYRYVAKTNRLSNHALGRAIDLNPYINPYIRDDYRFPPNVEYDPNALGAITADGLITQFLKVRGWKWGGDWVDRKDYQHFEKVLINQ